jgi:hypothetical protein
MKRKAPILHPCHLGIAALAMAAPLAAEGAPPIYAPPENLLWRGAGVAAVLATIWLILYKAVYPFFLRYYRADFCKTIFWNLFVLYSLTWLFLSTYLLLEVGFYWSWLHWVAAFLAVLWLISGLALLLQRQPA